jgi:cellulose biosynthesis protein BcsQ
MDFVGFFHLLVHFIRESAEVIAAFLVGAVAALAIRRWIVGPERARRRILELEKEAGALQRELERERQLGIMHQKEALDREHRLQRARLEMESVEAKLKTEGVRARLLYEQLESARSQSQGLEDQVSRAMDERARLLQLHEELTKELESERDRLNEQWTRLQELENRLLAIGTADGAFWSRKSEKSTPPFMPRAARQSCIIALANWKGGVGKTTVTACLGAALAKTGRRVLLVDLDFQGTLSALLLGQTPMSLEKEGKGIDRFLESATPTAELLLRLRNRLSAPNGRLDLIASTTQLMETRFHMLRRWLTDMDGPDIRYLLRSALHSLAVADQYDYILLDCRPDLDAPTVNAFAASDLVLIPVILTQASMEGVPRLLETVQRLRSSACPDLEVLGVLANRVKVYGGGMSSEQGGLWGQARSAWRAECKDLCIFEAWLPDHKAFAKGPALASDVVEHARLLEVMTEFERRVREHQTARAVPA